MLTGRRRLCPSDRFDLLDFLIMLWRYDRVLLPAFLVVYQQDYISCDLFDWDRASSWVEPSTSWRRMRYLHNLKWDRALGTADRHATEIEKGRAAT